MRVLLVTAVVSLAIVATPAFACGVKAQASVTDLSAQAKKPVKKTRKIKAKVEYMRAVPSN
ncbi:MAG TPA: hypothetical protein VGM57_08630 [Pseudolabrys sp.]|jgi:hypothetical protein